MVGQTVDSDSGREPRGIRVWLYRHPTAEGILRAILIVAIILGCLCLLAVLCENSGSGCPYSGP